MDKLLDHLYTTFLYRDILGYMAPGFITLYALCWAWGWQVDFDKLSKYKFFVLLVMSYLTGLVLFAVGTSGEKYSDWLLLRSRPTVAMSHESDNTSLTNPYAGRLESIPAKSRETYAMNILERFIALKHLYGNVALTCLIVSLCLVIRFVRDEIDQQDNKWHSFYQPDNLLQLGKMLAAFIVSIFLFTILLNEHWKVVRRNYEWQQVMKAYFADKQ